MKQNCISRLVKRAPVHCNTKKLAAFVARWWHAAKTHHSNGQKQVPGSNQKDKDSFVQGGTGLMQLHLLPFDGAFPQAKLSLRGGSYAHRVGGQARTPSESMLPPTESSPPTLLYPTKCSYPRYPENARICLRNQRRIAAHDGLACAS